MGNFLNDHPIVGPLALIAGVWAMGVITSLVFFLFENPGINGASNIAVSLVGLFALALLNIRKLKGIKD